MRPERASTRREPGDGFVCAALRGPRRPLCSTGPDDVGRTSRGATEMITSATLDELARRIGRAIEASPAKDVEKNVKALLQSGLAKLDVVPRAEFDVQAKVLARTREKLETLEKKVAELEARGRGA
jgi:BMFP domain-containing protein YqiC